MYPLTVVVRLVLAVTDENLELAERSLQILKEIHRLYQWLRTYDENWPKPTPSRRVLSLKPHHLPSWSVLSYEQAVLVWPVMPIASKIYEELRARRWPPETFQARLYEHGFITMCTHPTLLAPELSLLARHVLHRRKTRFPALAHPLIVADVADAVLDSFQKRSAAVARYVARASSIPEAARNVRRYMERAISRRANDVLEQVLSCPSDPMSVPPSTARRWRKNGLDLDDEEHIREVMRERQTGVKSGRVSVKALAKTLERSRDVIDRALRRAEKKHGFVTERGRGGTAQLTIQQARWVEACLPKKR